MLIFLLVLFLVSLVVFVLCMIILHSEPEPNYQFVPQGCEKNMVAYDSLCAGKLESAPAKIDALPPSSLVLRDKFGHLVRASRYKPFVIHGDSMRLVGIFDGDLVLSDEHFNVRRMLTWKLFPELIVIKSSCASGFNGNIEHAIYKLRRGWMGWQLEPEKVYSQDDVDRILKPIVANRRFRRAMHGCSFDYPTLSKDFLEKRIPDYQKSLKPGESSSCIISTTMEDGQLHFSIHSIDNIVGNIAYCFHMSVNKS